MRTILLFFLPVFLLVAGNAYAQEKEPVSLGTLLQTLPVPKPSLKEMMGDNTANDVVEKRLSGAFTTINRQIDVLYQAVYERFRKVMANPGQLKLTPAEQTMMRDIKLGAKGLSDASYLHFFRLQMTFRLPVGSGRPMWAFESPVAKSTTAQKIYQQLKSVEAGFNWKTFLSAAEHYVLKFGSKNQNLDDIDKKFNVDLENLPKKKVTLTGFTQETADPDKAIALCRKYGVQRQQVFEDEYAATYGWWNQQYQKLRVVAEGTDALSLELASMDAESRRSMQPFLADLQLRTLEALYKLTAVTQRLYNDRLIGLLADQQVKEMISLYTHYKAGE